MLVHTLGIEIDRHGVTATLIDRNAQLVAAHREDLRSGVRQAHGSIVDPAECASAAEFAISQVLDRGAIPPERIWGMGLVGPTGWIALDPAFRPLSPLRIATDPAPGEILEEIRLFLDAEPRAAAHLELLLSPKDYLRILWSGGIATDTTTAAHLDLLDRARPEWDPHLVEASPIPRQALPTVMDPEVPTGRVSEEGMRRTRLASGTWLVAGSLPLPAAMLAAGACRSGALYIELAPGSAPRAWRLGAAGEPSRERSVLPGIPLRSSPIGDSLPAPDGSEVAIIDFRARDADPSPIARWAESRGLEVRYSPFAGGPSAGGATLALLACGAFPRLESLYRKTIVPLESPPPG